MLERYFIIPATVDRIRRSWLARWIELYVAWLSERRFTARSDLRDACPRSSVSASSLAAAVPGMSAILPCISMPS